MEMADPDTIVAVGTPPGPSALAVVRLSGPAAASIAARLCPALPLPVEPRKPILAAVVDPGTQERIDQALVTVFPGPSSYTGEDMAEISCHGGWLSPPLILEACIRAGARQAEKGEFTRRAYLHGKLDLVQVEAIADLVESRSSALRRVALHHLERGLSRRIDALRAEVVGLEALLAHHLDFPEEDEPPIGVEEIGARARSLEGTLERLLSSAPEGELLREGALTVLSGRPNSGKSSLFNALLGQERAIVTEVPGTTRDALEAVISLGGFPFRLVDTAGLRESEGKVERKGIEVARRYLRGADLILFCEEGGGGIGPLEESFLEEVAGVPVVLVRTKIDLGGPAGLADGCGGHAESEGDGHGAARCLPGGVAALSDGRVPPWFQGCVAVSAETGQGLGDLRELLPQLVFGGLVESGEEVPVLSRRRQAQGIRTALDEVRGFREGIEGGLPAEVAATHLLSAETALEELVGAIAREEVLDRIFSEFCIGK